MNTPQPLFFSKTIQPRRNVIVTDAKKLPSGEVIVSLKREWKQLTICFDRKMVQKFERKLTIMKNNGRVKLIKTVKAVVEMRPVSRSLVYGFLSVFNEFYGLRRNGVSEALSRLKKKGEVKQARLQIHHIYYTMNYQRLTGYHNNLLGERAFICCNMRKQT